MALNVHAYHRAASVSFRPAYRTSLFGRSFSAALLARYSRAKLSMALPRMMTLMAVSSQSPRTGEMIVATSGMRSIELMNWRRQIPAPWPGCGRGAAWGRSAPTGAGPPQRSGHPERCAASPAAVPVAGSTRLVARPSSSSAQTTETSPLSPCTRAAQTAAPFMLGVGPHPLADLRHVLQVLTGIRRGLGNPGSAFGDQCGGVVGHARHPSQRLDTQMIAAHTVQHDHIERRRGRPLLI